jgi:hypothetical protein
VSRRIFVTVRRGMTDATAACVFPWELDILSLVHGQEIKEVPIEEMANQKDGVVKVERQKLKKLPNLKAKYAPDLRHQLEAMCYVDPDEDPALDPVSEYDRLAMKYGMDKDLPIACVTRVYGEFSSGAFEAKLKQYAKDSMEKPVGLRATDEGLEKAPDLMTIKELRDALKDRGVEWKVTESKADLVAKLEDNLAPA